MLSYIYISGHLSNSGFMSTDAGTLVLDGSNNQTISVAPISNLIINKAAGIVSLSGNLSIKGNVDIQSGTLDLGSYTINRNTAGGSFSMASGTTLLIGGNSNYPSNWTNYTLNNSSTVNYNSNNTQTIIQAVYGNLILSNGNANSKTLAGDITINGDFTINNNATFNGGNYTINLNGSLYNNGTFNASGSTINLAGANKEISGNNFSLNNVNVTGNYTIRNINVTFETLLNITKTGSFDLGSGNITVNGNLHNSGVLVSNGNLTFSGTKVQTIEYQNSISNNFNGTTYFNGTVAPIFNSNSTPHYQNLTINNTAGVSPSVNWIINGDFTVANGASFNGSIATHSFAGNITNNGTITFTTGTLLLNPVNTVNIALGNNSINSNGTIELGGTGIINLTGTFGTISNLTISNSNSNGVTLTSAVTLSNDLLITASGKLNAGTYTHTIAGDFDNQGTLIANSSTFILTGANNVVASGASSFNNVEIRGTISPDEDLNINGNLSITSSGKLMNDPLSSINFTGSGTSTISSITTPFYFNNINIQKSIPTATVTLAVNIDSLNLLSIISGKLDIDTFKLIEEPLAGVLEVYSAATLRIGGTKGLPVFTTYSLDSLSIIEFGGSTQTINNNINYGSIKVSGTNIKTATGALTILGDYEQTGGTFNAGNYTHSILGDWTVTGGTFNSTGSTIVFNGTHEQIINSVGAFNNVVINNTNGYVSLNADLQINGQLTLTNGLLQLSDKTLVLNGSAIAGNLSNLVTTAQSGLSYGGIANGISIPSGISELGSLTINNSNGITLNGSIKINNQLTLTSGSLVIGDNLSLTISGNHIRTTGTLSTTKKSNLIITGSGTTFNDLAFNTSSNGLSRLYIGRNVGIANTNGVSVYGMLSFINSNTTLTTNSAAANIGLSIKSTLDSTARIADITIHPFDGSTLSGNSISGNVLVERYISSSANRAWRLLGPTVSTTTSIRDNWQEGTNNPNTSTNNNPNPGYGCYITGSGGNTNGFDVTQTNAASLYNYAQATDSWVTVPNTNATTLDAKKGYLLYIRGGRDNLSYLNGSLASGNTTLRTVGTLLTGTQTFTGLNTIDGMFSLVTNPYASPLNWASVIQDATNSSHFSSTYTFWDPNIGTRGGYVSVGTNGQPSAGNANTNIQSGQAFFVQRKVGATSNILTVKEAHKAVTNNIDIFRSGTQTEILRTSLSFINSDGSTKLADGVLSLYNNTFSYDIDDNDAEQIENWDEDITIVHKGKNLSIDYRPLINQLDTIQLQVARLRTMNYQWEFKAENFNAAGLTAYLQDNYPIFHETPISLTGSTIITFSVTTDAASKAGNRFRIVYKTANALPVNITQLSAYMQNNTIKVDWKTQAEVNINSYVVEKSQDGVNYFAIGNVISNKAVLNSYSLLDNQPFKNNNYYRIKIISNNNEFNYSSVVVVKNSIATPSFSVYPNPVVGNTVNLSLNNLPKGNYTISIINQLGQKLITKDFNNNGTTTSVTMDVSKLIKGNYEIILNNEVIQITNHFLKG